MARAWRLMGSRSGYASPWRGSHAARRLRSGAASLYGLPGDCQETRRSGARGLEAFNLASIALSLGDWAEAKAYTEESFNLFRELGSKYGEAVSYSNFGFLALMDGDNQQAQSFFEQALELAWTSWPVWLGAMALVGLAAAAAGTQAWRAARLLGVAEARLKAGASYWGAVEKLCVGRVTATALAQLGETAFAAARAEGTSHDLRTGCRTMLWKLLTLPNLLDAVSKHL